MITYGKGGDGLWAAVKHNKVVVGGLRTMREAQLAAMEHAVGGERVCPGPVPEAVAEAPTMTATAKPSAAPVVIVAPVVEPSLLDLSIALIRERLSTGGYDHRLDEIEADERAGKTRKGALAAVAERRAALK